MSPEACNAQPCPVDCEWGTWTDFDACTTTCGGGENGIPGERFGRAKELQSKGPPDMGVVQE